VVVVGGIVVVVVGGDAVVLARLRSGPGGAEAGIDVPGPAPRLLVPLVEHELARAAASMVTSRPNLRPFRRRQRWPDLFEAAVLGLSPDPLVSIGTDVTVRAQAEGEMKVLALITRAGTGIRDGMTPAVVGP